jgi:SAM-dependent methyltransferase
MKPRCHICGEGSVELVPEFSQLRRVTSDCRPWSAGGRLGTCEVCATVQTVVDAHWQTECREIYQSYAIYAQGGGAEQRVFDSSSGASASRSDQLLDRLVEVADIGEQGRLIDIGCGNGGFLRSFSRRHPGWRLCGSEFDEKHRASIESIPGFEKFFSGDVRDLPGEFDICSLIHVLEHIEAPREFLGSVRSKLKAGGLLIVELPSFRQNPFELLIADHATHFEPATIESLLADTQFKSLHVTGEWIPKELSIVACALPPIAERTRPASEDHPSSAIHWLDAVRRDATDLARRSTNFGIFGTSIAATWLFSELEGKADFFVDEDPDRVGGRHLERPIYRSSDVPAGSDVYVVLPPKTSAAITARLGSAAARYHPVPASS